MGSLGAFSGVAVQGVRQLAVQVDCHLQQCNSHFPQAIRCIHLDPEALWRLTFSIGYLAKCQSDLPGLENWVLVTKLLNSSCLAFQPS